MICSDKQSKTVDLLFTWENVNVYFKKSQNLFKYKWFIKQKTKSYGISSNYSESISNEINLNSFITNVSIESESVKSNDTLYRIEGKTKSGTDALSDELTNNLILSNSLLNFYIHQSTMSIYLIHIILVSGYVKSGECLAIMGERYSKTENRFHLMNKNTFLYVC
jgi:hypothetical protein